jgi:DNA helicase-2/ATP-dependent DNA helicase PcrA
MGKAIEEFVKYFTKASRFIKDLEYKKVKVEQIELNQLLIERFADKPLYERIELIADKINNRYYKGLENDFNHIKNKLFKIVNFPVDCKEIYKAFFKSAIFSKYYTHMYKQNENERNLDEEIIRYEDATPFIYMKCLLGGYPYQVYMRQVVVDEAQDYTYLQYKILRHIFKNADFTILGDVNQTVNPFYKYDNLNVLLDLFEDSRYIELNKTYRSSPEIIEHANKILGLKHVSAIRRDQNLPVIKREMSDIKHIGRDINYLHSKYKSVAIITKTIDEAKLICQSFKKNFDIISVIDINTETFKTDLVVAPAYGVKGLEFDACLIVNNFDSDPYLYYVAVTRAQHELIVYE